MNRIDILNHLVKKYGYTSYLEIGCATDVCFSNVQVDDKIGVDPEQGGTVRSTSDDYFATCNRRFDLVFVDGLHHYQQVLKDVHNAANHLNPNGRIVLHDCLPTSEYEQDIRRVKIWEGGPWTGDVWKAAVELTFDSKFDTVIVDTDFGCGVVRITHRPMTIEGTFGPDPRYLTWHDFEAHKNTWLQIVSEEWFLENA